MIGKAFALLALAALTSGPAQAGEHALSAGTYARAERYLPWNIGKYAENLDVAPRWLSADMLVYRTGSAAAWRFHVYDLKARAILPAFDHAAMAEALGAALGRTLSPERLPISVVADRRGDRAVDVVAEDASFQCDLTQGRCTRLGQSNADAGNDMLSNGIWAIFRRGYDLWRRDLRSGGELQLTFDGGPSRLYGARPGTDTIVTLARNERGDAPVGEFSPDRSELVVQVIDESRVPELDLLQSVPEDGTIRPRLWRYHRPFPGDPAPTASLALINLQTGLVKRINHEMAAQLGGPIPLGQVSWSGDGGALYILDHQDEYRRLALLRADRNTGGVRTLIAESRETNVLAMNALRPVVLSSGEILWPSERSGWMHLYLYDRSGRLKRSLTHGSWVVREILDVDEAGRKLLIAGSGRMKGQDPYYRQIYRVGLDDGAVTQVTRENADHKVASAIRSMVAPAARPINSGVSPDGRYIVDALSAPDLPTRTVLRSVSGPVLATLARASIDAALGYRAPEPFSATAADGKTQLFGTIFFPSTFDPARSYPLIDLIYPGPQAVQVDKRFLGGVHVMPLAQALAELGLLVVAIDGRGTPLRSRAFREASYGRLGSAGFLEDHIATIRQLSARRPYIDPRRLAAVGHSAGGFAVVHALCDYPGFFTIGVASSGNHDLRLYSRDWGTKYQGSYNRESYARQTVFPKIESCRGSLFLATGDMDDNVHPANSFRLVDALIKANKDFELLVVPNENHDLDRNPYFIRRTWDFLVRHLLDAEPPQGYAIAGPPSQKTAPLAGGK